MYGGGQSPRSCADRRKFLMAKNSSASGTNLHSRRLEWKQFNQTCFTYWYMVCNGHINTCLACLWFTCPQGCRQSMRGVWSSVGGCKGTDPRRKPQGFQPAGEGFQQLCSLIAANPSAGAQTSLALNIKLIWAGRQWWGTSMHKQRGTGGKGKGDRSTCLPLTQLH